MITGKYLLKRVTTFVTAGTIGYNFADSDHEEENKVVVYNVTVIDKIPEEKSSSLNQWIFLTLLFIIALMCLIAANILKSCKRGNDQNGNAVYLSDNGAVKITV